MKNKKINKINIAIAVFLIILTVSMPISFAALRPEIRDNEIKENPFVDSFVNFLKKIISFFDIMPSVLAQGSQGVGCCEVMKNGAKCQISTLDECQSAQQWHFNQTCDTICQIGCCIDAQGFCSKQAISTQCLVPPALKFIPNDPQCQQDVLCKYGCCTIGYQKIWTTNLTCSAVHNGVWDGSVPDELACIQQAYQEQRGCCRSYAGCEYITGAECQAKGGEFFSNKKCYDSIPGCEKCQGYGTPKCVEGFPDLYKTDNCGNAYIDEIKEQCSSSGKFCNPETNACESGECRNVYDNYKGNGDFTALPGRHGQSRESGESWCVYDRPDLVWGNGTEPAGSRHWRIYCLYGKEYVEPCADYRQQICVEGLFDVTQGEILENVNYQQRYSNQNYRSIATCMGNPWRVCLLLNDEAKCNANPGCFWITGFAPLIGKKVEDIFRVEDDKEKGWAGVRADTLEEVDSHDPQIGKIFGPPRCLPKIPPGLDVGFNQFQNRENICNLGSYVCTVEDRLLGGDKNPECNDREWMELMAHRCRAIADCGVWFNYLHSSTKSTATQDGILIAEVNPKYEGGRVTAKDIEINYQLLNDSKFERYKEIIKDPSKTFEMRGEEILEGGWGWGLLLLIADYLGSALLSKSFTLGFFHKNFKFLWMSKGTGWFWGKGIGLLNAWSVIGGILILLSLIPGLSPPVRDSLRTAGFGLTAGGIAAALGASTVVAIFIGAGVALFYALFIAVWDVDNMVVQCMPWMPPVGGEDCHVCNEDPMRPCSEYRCQSLGTACVWNGTTADGKPCEQSPEEECGVCRREQNDGVSPLITKVSIKEEGYSVSPQQPGIPPTTIVISKNGNNPVDPWSSLTIQLEFNERAACKWHTAHTTSFNEMPPAWFGTNTFKYNQSQTISVGQLIHGYNTIEIYLRCADVYMNANVGEYIIKFTVSTSDLTPPVVLGTDRDYYNKFSYGMTQLPLFIYVNEMATCRWAKQDVDYSLMSSETECRTSLTSTGFKCHTTLTGLQSEPPGIANTFYIRCKDTAGNVMQQSYQLVLYSALPLFITSIVPENGAHIKSCEISGIELKVETAEGAENGKATCYWKNNSEWQRFSVTNDVVHLTNLSAISQTVSIKCVDSALNVAQNSTTFTVEKDETQPKITRIYKEGSRLVLRTDENATCAYRSLGQGCDFNATHWLQAIKFSTTNGLEHSTEWRSEPWYVKCYDSCGNGGKQQDPCIVISPSDVEFE